jgi:hypothetical protein
VLKQHSAINESAKKKNHYLCPGVNFNARVSQIEFTVNSNIIGVHVVQYGLFYALC